MALVELLQKSSEADFLRAVAESVLQILMEADVEGLIGRWAARAHRRSVQLPERLPRPHARYPARTAQSPHPEAAAGLASPAFEVLLRQMLDDPNIGYLLRSLSMVATQIDQQVAELDGIIAALAKASDACRRLMTVPGVGPLVALTYVSAVDQPGRFRNARTVGAHFGLTPRRYQSGEMDWSGRISRAGDAAVRRALYQAANVLMHHSKRWCALKSWAVRLAKRRGLAKAKVALARKLAVVMHKMWTTGENYRLEAAA